MSFLNGIFLLALPLAVAPVILHFYRRRQRDVVPWGAMQFLFDAAKKGRRWERLEELLLMLLRCAAVLALVLALARPQLRGTWFGEQPMREVILVLDNSMSMSRAIDGETPFAELQKQAKDVIEDLSNSDLVQVMLAVGGPDWLTPEAVAIDPVMKARLQRDVDELVPSLGGADLFSSVQAAIDAEPTQHVQARHIMVLTDRQAHGWQAGAARNWQQLHEAMQQNEMPTSVQVVPCGVFDDPSDNVALVGIEASHTQVGPRQTVTLQAQVQNFGLKPSPPTKLEQLVNAEVTGISDIPEIASGGTVSVSWKWQSSDSGVFALSGRIKPDDQLAADDEGTVIVEVVDRIPVLIVTTTAEYRQRVAEADFLTAALGYDGESPHDDWHAVFAPHSIQADELEGESLSGYQAVVLTGLTPMVTQTVEKLRRFVEQGGGLWVMLGRRTDREAFNSAWYQDGGGLSPLPLGEMKTRQDDTADEETIHPPSGDHPATAALADTGRLDIDAVRIRSRHTFDRQAAGDDLSVLLETGDGDPLVIEHYLGRGRVIVQTLPFDVAWSNLPLTKSHVVLVNDWLAYLTQPAATQFNVPTDGRIDLPQAKAGENAEVNLISPDGRDHLLAVRDADDVPRFRYSNTVSPGRYEVRYVDGEDATHVIPFQVARDAEESDLTSLTDEQQSSLADNSGLTFSESATIEMPEIPHTSSERSVWNPLLIGLLILLAGELWLATLSARSRSPEMSLPSFLETAAPSATRAGTSP